VFKSIANSTETTFYKAKTEIAVAKPQWKTNMPVGNLPAKAYASPS